MSGPASGDALRVLTWNLFHGRDGHPAARATPASTLLGRRARGGGHVHLDRDLSGAMARVVARIAPDIAALQEVPLSAVPRIARITGMHALWAPTGPLVGPAGLRERLRRAHPDLWRTHGAGANVLLVGPRLAVVAGTARRMTLNDPLTMAVTAWHARPPARELAHWAGERRTMAWAALRRRDGTALSAACVHLHNGRPQAMGAAEAARAAGALAHAAAGAGPGILAGDINGLPGGPAHAALRAAGWDDAGPADGIDRILHRGLAPAEAPRALPADARTALVPDRGRWARVLLSDHAPVVGAYRIA